MAYKHLFFDLDHTLWDFKTNSTRTLSALYNEFQINQHFDSFEQFHTIYNQYNASLWFRYRNKLINKKEIIVNRFALPLEKKGFTDKVLQEKIAYQYLKRSPLETQLMPDALEVIQYLHQKKYQLYIITNGFCEVQRLKLEQCGLLPYFTKLFISDEIGIAKPSKHFFDYAVTACNAKRSECLVIGDSLEADIKGAIKANIDTLFFNIEQKDHRCKVNYEISKLIEIKSFL